MRNEPFTRLRYVRSGLCVGGGRILVNIAKIFINKPKLCIIMKEIHWDIPKKGEGNMKKTVLIAFVFVIAATLAVCAMAEGDNFAKDSARAIGTGAKNTVQYTGNVVYDATKTVGKAVKGTAETVADTTYVTGKTLVGKENPKEVVATPVKGTANTVKNAAENTAKTPVSAYEATKEQNQR